MKKLMIAVLVPMFVFGMVGLAQAALHSETFAQSYTLGQNTKVLYAFDLFSQWDTVTTNYSQLISNATKSGPNTDGILNPAEFALSSPFTLSFAFANTASLNNGASLNVYLYDTISDATNNTNNFAISSLSLKGKSAGSIAFTDQSLFSHFTDGKVVAVVYGTGLGTKTFSLNQASFSTEVQPVPLPAAGLLLCSGLIGLIGIRRKQSL